MILSKQQAFEMYRTYLLSFTEEDLTDYNILSFDEWVKENKILENN